MSTNHEEGTTAKAGIETGTVAGTETMSLNSKTRLKRQPKNVRARMADVVIRILTDINPRRQGSAAFDHFEKMRGGITVREYLAKFSKEDQRTARQWLWNTIQDGHVKTLGT